MRPSERSPEIDVGDDVLFDVYARAGNDGQEDRWLGMGLDEGANIVIEGRSGELKARRVPRTGHLQVLSERLKQGYRHQGRRFYNPRARIFTPIHPDMDWKGAKVVLLSRHSDVVSASALVTTTVRSTPAWCITSEEVDAWQRQQERNAAHVVAFSDHPIWALALAEVAMIHGWDWRMGPGWTQMPNVLPSRDPNRWCLWLRQVFDENQIREAQRGIGWTVEALLTQHAPDPSKDGLASLL